MAWNNNRYQPQAPPIPNGDQAMAVDWDVKRIPGASYKACLITQESLMLSRNGLDHVGRSLSRFVAAVSIYHRSVAKSFDEYLLSKDYAEDKTLLVKEDKTKYTAQDYYNLTFFVNNPSTNADSKFRDVTNMFIILLNWCQGKGPFRVYNDVEVDDEDVFKRLERELQ